MQGISFHNVKIEDPFWSPRLIVNETIALNHQWEQLEASGCIENFRILAHASSGIHRGWFFADSDAYKWLDAASRTYATRPDKIIKEKIDSFVSLITHAQEPDGYLYTYNQILFPEKRWENLNIEHEMYCHGHLIEGAIAHYEGTGEDKMLLVAMKAADLLVNIFYGAGSQETPGHEEIEIALIRLADLTGNQKYLDLAEQFLETRGIQSRINFALELLRENDRVNRRNKLSKQAREVFYQKFPQEKQRYSLPDHNESQKPPLAGLRFTLSGLNGKYFQKHKPIEQQHIPVGHAVRFAYLETAAAMLVNRRGNYQLEDTLRTVWNHMVERRMYVTGGTGSLPISEGFGRDYELDPYFAYAETCAAIGTMYWDWEMTNLFSEAKYAELFERQLYNASLVGIGQNGNSYLYNNPLSCKGGLDRQPWFEVPCCPSNISRTWASLGNYIYSCEPQAVWIHQYIGNHTSIPMKQSISIEMSSKFPWEGESSICIHGDHPVECTLHLRIPAWASQVSLILNDEELPVSQTAAQILEPTASGYDPRTSQYLPVKRTWHPGDKLTLKFDMPIRIHRPHPKVKSVRGKIAISRGPLVYCLESIDTPEIDIFEIKINPQSLEPEFDPTLFGGVVTLNGESIDHHPITLIPYAWWANRGASSMTVYIKNNK